MEYTIVQEYCINPDSIELEDFCNICAYVKNHFITVNPYEEYILSLMTTDHLFNIEDNQIVIAYLPQKWDRYKYIAEIRMVSLDEEHWFIIHPITVELELVSLSKVPMRIENPLLAILTVDDNEHKLYKEDFDKIFQENGGKDEETSGSNDGNSSIG